MNGLLINQLPAAFQALVLDKDLAAGQILFNQHDPAEGVFILQSGHIQLLNYTEDGHQVNHYGVQPGESFAEVALFYEHYLCTAIATTPARVLIVPKQPYLLALQSYPEVTMTFMAQLAERLHQSKILLELRSIRSAQKRVLHYLQLNVHLDGNTVNLDRPLKAIASDLGLTPEALSRALKQLDQEGMISRNKRKVTLRKEFAELDSNHGGSNNKLICF
jgi:CRP/FNR family transcriptional regulator, dissimilatory nitrate respiration regulator